MEDHDEIAKTIRDALNQGGTDYPWQKVLMSESTARELGIDVDNIKENISMDFNTYQEQALTTAKESARNLNYLGLGLAGEAGEVAEKLKKAIRDRAFDPDALAKELGDVLWYVSVMSHQLGYELSEVANMNLDKLESRKARGKIGGSGDDR